MIEVTLNGRVASAEIVEWTDATGWTCDGEFAREQLDKAVQPVSLTWLCTIPREPVPVTLQITGASRAEMERLVFALLIETEV